MGMMDPSRMGTSSIYWSNWACGSPGTCMTGFDPYLENGSQVWDDRYNAGRACREYMRKCVRSPDGYYDDAPSLMRCCTSTDPIVEVDCKPGYCPGSAQCDSLMRKYCATGFPAGTAFENKCKSWCIARQGQCDQSAREYCKNHPEDKDFCACLNSPLARSIGGAPAIPSCFDGGCIARGYQTSPMLETAKHCPEFCSVAVQCIQETGGSCNISDVDFRNACGKAPPIPGCKIDAECGGGKKCIDGKCVEPPAPPKPKTNIVAIILIILVVLLALVIAASAFRSKGKEEKSGGGRTTGSLSS